MTKLNIINLLQFIKEQDVLSNTKVVVGGPDVTYNIHDYLQAGADIVVFGEGEQTMLDIVSSIQQGVDQHFAHIPGLAYLDVTNASKQTIEAHTT